VRVIISSYFLFFHSFFPFFFLFFHSSYTIKDVHVILCLTFLGYVGYCMSFENVFFVCLHVRLICALNYYLLTYLLSLKHTQAGLTPRA